MTYMAWVMGVLAQSAAAAAQSVVFINPGRSDERYWTTVSEAMQDAASSLGMQLQVRYAQRDHLRPIEIARQIAALPKAQRPRYVMFTNDYSVAPEILRTLEAAGIDSFMAFSGVPETLRGQTGVARERYRHWLGSLEPGAEEAGYLTAKSLFAAARASGQARAADGRLHMVAIAGDRSTPSSVERNAGMRRAAAEASDVVLQQEVFGEWRRERAEQQAAVLFQRYPEVRLVWAGNDEMAFGAMQAWRARGGLPGRDAFFSAINSSAAAMTALRTGELSALAGGHFLTGAWALVMLYDHAHGTDFASEGLEQVRPMFTLLDKSQIDRYEHRISAPLAPLDFRSYSKHLNPRLRRYGFELKHLLR
ncbi:ABC transporter substrate-binding protein [Delftia acidovorans]|uniref:ABC transporter substrate-binding protein n=1 Tax=Delftia acidovorans TaxID=80866 RepID=UPI0028B219A8|nr:ABC transporter substrate-binding protein [Delftia acidovorans]